MRLAIRRNCCADHVLPPVSPSSCLFIFYAFFLFFLSLAFRMHFMFQMWYRTFLWYHLVFFFISCLFFFSIQILKVMLDVELISRGESSQFSLHFYGSLIASVAGLVLQSKLMTQTYMVWPFLQNMFDFFLFHCCID